MTYIFDFDSTLVQVESLDELAKLALADHPDSAASLTVLEELTARGMAGELPFDESLKRRLQMFEANKHHIEALTDLLSSKLSPSALAHAEWFSHNQDNVFVISGGFNDYIVPVLKPLGIHSAHIFANNFLYDQQGNIIGYDQTSLLSMPKGKSRQVAELALPRPIVVVGDGYTDYEILEAGEADEFWAFTETSARPNAVVVADRVVTSFADIL